MKILPLSNGKYAKVDDEDFDRLSNFKWNNHSIGYGVRYFTINGEETYRLLHHEIVGRIDGLEVDHIDGDPSNNQKANLRFVNHQQNIYRKLKSKSTTLTSSYKGVSWHSAKKMWRADIKVSGRTYQLGYFDSETEAAKAYDKMAKSPLYFGEFARLNFPE